jgi:hypothetical protein
MKNPPYVKIYENEILTNPITDKYESGNSLRKLNRGHERFVKHRTLKNKLNEQVIMFQVKSKRGRWILKNYINADF